MDETLKAYAGKRQQEAGAPFELHPATRQMLQGEVARTYTQAPRVSWFQRVIVFWPRMAFAAACVAITLTLVLMISPPERMMEMAKTAAPANESMRDARLADGEQDKEQEKLMDRFVDAPALAPAAPLSSTAPVMPAKPADGLAKRDDDNSGDVKAKSELMAEARKDGADVKPMREESVGKEVARQSYSNFDNAEAASRARSVQLQQQKQDAQLGTKPASVEAVLKNFDFEQRGNEIKITDGDGSIYVGNVISQDEAKKRSFRVQNAPPKAQTGAIAGAAGPAEAQSQTLFYAFGTNVSLKQEVSIEGNILQISNALTPPSQAPASRALNESLNRRSVGNAAFQQAIQGRARVGTNQEVFINAVPSQP